MHDKQAQAILDKIIGQITGYKNPFSLEQFAQKFAYDIDLPKAVHDAVSGEITWTQTVGTTKFMTFPNVLARGKKEGAEGWDQPKRDLKNMQDILRAWQQINYTAAERQLDSIDVAQSDTIYSSEKVWRSQDVAHSKRMLFCEGVSKSEYVAASQRSHSSTYCVRLQDSGNCSNSFGVQWSDGIVNSLFVSDSRDLYECLFCSHLMGKQYCIANMQFDEAEYRTLKDQVLRWLLGGAS